MTSVNDSAAALKMRRSALSPEELDRLAATIKPSWELGGALVTASAAAGADEPADTLIEGMPTVDVPGVPISSRSEGAVPRPAAAPRPAAPAAPFAPPQKTMLGMGAGEDEPAAAPPAIPILDESTEVLDPVTVSATTPLPTVAATAAPSPAAAPPASTKAAPAATTGARASGAAPASERSGKAPASRRKGSAAPQAAARPQSTGEPDAIDLPITKSGGTIVKVLIGAAALIGVIVGVKMLTGSDRSTTAPTSTAATPTAPRPDPTPAATAKPTAAPAGTPAAAATAAPTSTPSATPSAKPSAAPTSTPAPIKTTEPVAQTPPTKAPNPGTTKTPPPPGGTKKPPTGGGIIRETPF